MCLACQYVTYIYIICKNKQDMEIMVYGNGAAKQISVPMLNQGLDEAFSYFKKIIRENSQPPLFSPSSLSNNSLVVEVLDAAKKSARKEKTIHLNKWKANH